jgi:hypothetical protein
MFGDGSLTLREFAMNEPLPLARIHDAVLEFLRHRDDAVLFGAQAVNAYVDEPRMTQDVDILSTRAPDIAEELRQHLAARFHIAVRIREVADGKGFRIFQMRQPKNRHLADVRKVDLLPPNQRVADVRVPIPEELIAQKMISYAGRIHQPKGDTDRRDLKMLLIQFPHLKSESGPVADRLRTLNAGADAMNAWRELAVLQFEPEPDEDAGY